MDIQFSQHQFLKDTILIPVDLSWYPCQKSIAYEGMGLFLNSQFYTSITKLLNHYFPNHSAHFSSMMKDSLLFIQSFTKYFLSTFYMSGIMWVLRGGRKILSLRLGLGEKLSLEDFPGGPVVKNPPYNAGDAGLILG